MGVVYRAYDQRLRRSVAVKMLPERLAADAQAVERFHREARAASALNHPNICAIFDVGEHDGRPYLVMELLEGATLRERIGPCGLPLEELLEIGIQTADALDVAHAEGILHRDIKPENIFITSRRHVKLMDFGLAQLVPDRSRTMAQDGSAAETLSMLEITAPGTALGTVAYMSPEQARGEELDSRTDLFSFGAVLYEMAAGKEPFAGNTNALIFDSILNRKPVPPLQARPALP